MDQKNININYKDILDAVKKNIDSYRSENDMQKIGRITSMSDGVATISGIDDIGVGEIIEIDGTDGSIVLSLALNLANGSVGAVVLGDEKLIKSGAKVTTKNKILSIPVGKGVLGRIIDPLGRPLDGLGEIKSTETYPLENTAPGVLDRKSVHEPLMTGIMAIDSLVPIGRGQRELIIGDRQTGKTAIALDTIINQATQKTGVINIYVAIGQKMSKIARFVEKLKSMGAFDNTVVVVSRPSDPAALSYLAPYAGCAIGEYFRDNKQHALVIYDDLSKHAVAYRQISLLLKRPPGREAYPGDVFYLHSRLLERAAKLSDKLGAGSLTALPIIETLSGDISAYIPTNVISITDGQIFMESSLFYQGIRPAVGIGLSVSRVGSAAQTKAIKTASGSIKLGLAQYRELEAFSQFSSDLDAETKAKLDRGAKMVEILKQPQFSPYSVAQQYVLLSLATSEEIKQVKVSDVAALAKEILDYISLSKKEMVEKLNTGDKPDQKINDTLKEIFKKFADGFTAKDK